MIEVDLRAGLLAGVPAQVRWAQAGDEAGFAARPGEGELIARAGARRRADFARGRLAARAALAAAGARDAPLLADSDRVPRWPPDFVGSIAHTEGVAVAVVARTREVAALGVDVEVAAPLDAEVWDRVLAPPERAVVRGLAGPERGWAALRYFCAKEAAYKAGFPARRVIIEFDAMRVVFAGDEFVARWDGSATAEFVGRCARVGAHQFAAAWQLAPGLPATAAR